MRPLGSSPSPCGPRTPRARPSHFPAAALILLAALPACVVERSPTARPGTVGPLNPPAPPGTAQGGAAAKSTRESPLAGMAGESATFSIWPLGLLPYDGLTLPLISSSGRFFATQTGQPPPWDVVLSQPGAVPWLGSRVEVFERIDPAPPTAGRPSPPGDNQPDDRRAGLRRLTPDAWGHGWGDGLPAGLLLGRSADDAGFLVELPRADGSRAIGRVAWPTAYAFVPPGGDGPPAAALEWLLDDGGCNTDAVLITNDVLLVARRAAKAAVPGAGEPPARPQGPDTFVLARFARNGGPPTERAVPGRSLRFPLVSADRRYAVCMAIDPAGILPVEAVVVALDQPDMPVLARLPAGAGASLGDAYQAAASTQALPRLAERSELAWLSAADRGLVRLDMTAATPPVREAGLLAAVPIDAARELAATATGVRQRQRGGRGGERAGTRTVLEGVAVTEVPGLPRDTGAPGEFLVLGASAGGEGLKVDVLVFGK